MEHNVGETSQVKGSSLQALCLHFFPCEGLHVGELLGWMPDRISSCALCREDSKHCRDRDTSTGREMGE